jgi:signal transduction histidine kinase
MSNMPSSPTRWVGATLTGYYRSAVLVAVAGVVPAITIAVAVFGLSFSRSWSAHLAAPQLVRLVAAVGEWAMAALWTTSAFGLGMMGLGPPTTRFLRRYGGRWLGRTIALPHRPPRPITRMSTGYWWNGYGYHETERGARTHAWWMEHSMAMSIRGRLPGQALSSTAGRDPQLQRDVTWQAVAAVTVVPVAALPLLFAAAAIYAAAAGSALWLVLLVGSLAVAPFAWRIFSPVALRYLASDPNATAEKRIAHLESIRADLTHTQAAELERIERSLHDGAQARIVSMGMYLNAAERLVNTDPERAKEIIREARDSTVIALDQLRTLVRGINPPVLVERGLVDAVRALALDAPLEVDVHSTLAGRPEQPIEAAVYFSVAELLTNVAKHSHAGHAHVELTHAHGVLRVSTSDDGIGGAAASTGSGLEGVTRRVTAFGGHVDIDSPPGGPTGVTLTVPCELS